MHSIITTAVRSCVGFAAFGAVCTTASGTWAAGWSSDRSAAIVLDTLFQDHAVLQRDRVVPVRGSAAPGEKISVAFGSMRVEAVAGADGRFSVDLPPMAASLEPRELVVSGASGEARAKDLLVGEVWFCSGQSNMEWVVDGSNEADRAKEMAARLPIRSFKAPHVTSNMPKSAVEGSWRVATAQTVGGFTAVGYWFGVDLARAFDLEVPIGLVDISWGGTRIEPWIPLDCMAKSDFKTAADGLAASIAQFRAIKPEDKAQAVAAENKRYLAARGQYWDKVIGDELNGRGAWTTPEKSTGFPAEWGTTKLPAFFPATDSALATFDGFVWYTRAFTVPAEMASKPCILKLPAIDDCDRVLVDGVEVGSTIGDWNTPRSYALPNGLAAGEHRMTITVLDMSGEGGFAQGAMQLVVDGSKTPIALDGNWNWRKGGKVPGVAFPRVNDLNREPGTDAGEPAAIYNAMMAPCISFPVRGTIWYQGESNAGEHDNYRKLLPLLMNSWREKSGNPDMAWGIVQLAGFMPFAENEPAQGGWALLREAQFRGAAEAKGGMISATDIGEAGDIHPKKKREVGDRLSAWARNTVYGEKGVQWKGPELSKASRSGAKVVCEFDNAAGLGVRGDRVLGGFAVAGADGKFVWATTKLDGNQVVLEAAGVADPVEVAYAWQNNPQWANLVNGAGLPAVPFRVKVAQ